jgi:hypothetical protein
MLYQHNIRHRFSSSCIPYAICLVFACTFCACSLILAARTTWLSSIRPPSIPVWVFCVSFGVLRYNGILSTTRCVPLLWSSVHHSNSPIHGQHIGLPNNGYRSNGYPIYPSTAWPHAPWNGTMVIFLNGYIVPPVPTMTQFQPFQPHE